MLVGKRPRLQLSRTTSMTRFEPDVVVDPMEVMETPQPSVHRQELQQNDWLGMGHVAGIGVAVSPRSSSGGSNPRRTSGDFVAIKTAPFLKKCGLCSRRLRTGKDIYMYRGEIAFCSLECRQQQIVNDEWLEKRALSAIKTETPTATAAGGSEASGSGEIVAIALSTEIKMKHCKCQ